MSSPCDDGRLVVRGPPKPPRCCTTPLHPARAAWRQSYTHQKTLQRASGVMGEIRVLQRPRRGSVERSSRPTDPCLKCEQPERHYLPNGFRACACPLVLAGRPSANAVNVATRLAGLHTTRHGHHMQGSQCGMVAEPPWADITRCELLPEPRDQPRRVAHQHRRPPPNRRTHAALIPADTAPMTSKGLLETSQTLLREAPVAARK